MSLLVLDPGLATRVVDFGRPRSRHLGVAVGGAADRALLSLGNALVGNSPSTPALEISLKGPILRTEVDLGAVVVGPPFVIQARTHVVVNKTFNLRAGDELYVGGSPVGVCCYLCVPGGFQVPTLLESCSGLDPLRAGDILSCRESRVEVRGMHGPCEFMSYPNSCTLRVLPGPQHDWFPSGILGSANFRVTPASNRMGLRLIGPTLPVPARELISEPVCPGAVQVTRDGQCIILGIDGQTIGGYPKIAHVIQADLDRLGQARPGTQIQFASVTHDEASNFFRVRRSDLDTWLTRVRLSLASQ